MTLLSEALTAYVHDHASPGPAIFDRLRAETHASLEMPQMQVGRVEGAFLKLMVQITGAERVLEVGTYSGYSAMSMASGLPDGGKLITCDIDPVATSVARRYWDESPWGDKIELRLGDAVESLANMVAAGETFDLVFIDADKGNYVNYYEHALNLVPSGGVILADNTLWSGKVISPEADSDHAIVAFNKHVVDDERVEQVLLSVRDGVMLARKR